MVDFRRKNTSAPTAPPTAFGATHHDVKKGRIKLTRDVPTFVDYDVLTSYAPTLLAAPGARDGLPTAPMAEGAPLAPVHPGEILLEEFIRPHGLTPIRTAQRLGVPRTRVERLVAGDTPVTVDTALRLERLFGASAEFWMNLQTAYELTLARAHPPEAVQAIAPLEQPAAHG